MRLPVYVLQQDVEYEAYTLMGAYSSVERAIEQIDPRELTASGWSMHKDGGASATVKRYSDVTYSITPYLIDGDYNG